MSKTRKILSALVCIAMVLSMVTSFAYASDSNTGGGIQGGATTPAKGAVDPENIDYEAVVETAYIINNSWRNIDLRDGKEVSFYYRGSLRTQTYDPNRHFRDFDAAYSNYYGPLIYTNILTDVPVFIFAPGTYDETIHLHGNGIILGANAGINPNDPTVAWDYTNFTTGWAANSAWSTANETVLAGGIERGTRTGDEQNGPFQVYYELAETENGGVKSNIISVADGVVLTGINGFGGKDFDIGAISSDIYEEEYQIPATGGRSETRKIQNSYVRNYTGTGSDGLFVFWDLSAKLNTAVAKNVRFENVSANGLFYKYIKDAVIDGCAFVNHTNKVFGQANDVAFGTSGTYSKRDQNQTITMRHSVWANNNVNSPFRFGFQGETEGGNNITATFDDNIFYNPTNNQGTYGIFVAYNSVAGRTVTLNIQNNQFYQDVSDLNGLFNSNAAYQTATVNYNVTGNKIIGRIKGITSTLLPNAAVVSPYIDRNYYADNDGDEGKPFGCKDNPVLQSGFPNGFDMAAQSYYLDSAMTVLNTDLDIISIDVGGSGASLPVFDNGLKTAAFQLLTGNAGSVVFNVHEGTTVGVYSDEACTTAVNLADVEYDVDNQRIHTYYVKTSRGTVSRVYTLLVTAVTADMFVDTYVDPAGKINNTAILVDSLCTAMSAGSIFYTNWDGTYYGFTVGVNAFGTLEEVYAYADANSIATPQALVELFTGDISIPRSVQLFAPNHSTKPFIDTVGVGASANGANWTENPAYMANQLTVGSITVAATASGTIEMYGFTFTGNFYDQARAIDSPTTNIRLENMMLNTATNLGYIFRINNGKSSATGDPNSDDTFTAKNFYIKMAGNKTRLIGEYCAAHTTFDGMWLDGVAANMNGATAYVKTSANDSVFTIKNSNLRNWHKSSDTSGTGPISLEGYNKALIGADQSNVVVYDNNTFYRCAMQHGGDSARYLFRWYDKSFSGMQFTNNYVERDDTAYNSAFFHSNDGSQNVRDDGSIVITGNKFNGISGSFNVSAGANTANDRIVLDRNYVTKTLVADFDDAPMGIRATTNMGTVSDMNGWYLDFEMTRYSDTIYNYTFATADNIVVNKSGNTIKYIVTPEDTNVTGEAFMDTVDISGEPTPVERYKYTINMASLIAVNEGNLITLSDGVSSPVEITTPYELTVDAEGYPIELTLTVDSADQTATPIVYALTITDENVAEGIATLKIGGNATTHALGIYGATLPCDGSGETIDVVTVAGSTYNKTYLASDTTKTAVTSVTVANSETAVYKIEVQGVSGLLTYTLNVTRAAADRTALMNAIAAAGALTLDNYTVISKTALTDAVTAGNALPATASQTEVDNAALAINNAITGLVDMTAFNAKLAEVKTINNDSNSYCAPTFTALRNAISAAEASAAGFTAAVDVAAAVSSLESAKAGLRTHLFTNYVSNNDATCDEDGTKTATCETTDCGVTDTIDDTDSKLGHNWTETGRTNATCTEDGVINYVCSHDNTHTKSEPITKLGHDWATEWTVDVEATCETAGSKSHHCSRCDEKSDVTVIEALGHDWDETSRTNATCTEDGVINYVCSHDATHTKSEPITKLGHDWATEWTVDVEATCETAGSKSHHCSRCDEKSDVTVIEALGHTFATEFTVDVEATCETAGSKSKHCTDTNCDVKTEVTPIAPLGHDWDETSRTNATCTEDGVINYVCSHDATHTKTEPITKLGHDWATEWTVDVEATCETAGSKSHHCSRCDEKSDVTVIEALGHDWDETGRTNATCTEDGVINYVCSHDNTHTKTEPITKLGHDWATEWTVDVEATCETAGSKSHHCSRCDEKSDVTVIEALGHDWDETGRTAPTCTEDGVINYVCSHDATHTKTEPIAKLGHDWETEWTIDVEPTAETAGSKSHHCSRCDEVTDVTVIDPLGHTFATEFTVDVEPTCETAGSKSKHCTDTNCDVKTEVTPIAPLGHDWTETGRINATCTEDGVINYVCSHDNTHTKTEPIDALGHDWATEWTVDVEATCETAGSKSHHCSRCDEKNDVTVIEALGHDWDETGRTNATCTEDGVINYVCSHDNTHTKNEPITKLGHNWETEFTVDVEPTCETAGSKSHHCSRCDDVTEVTPIAPLGHDWDETGRTNATCTEDGVINYVCSHDATHTKSEPIDALGHDWATEWTVDVEATCETAGSKSHHCSRCDEKNDVTVIEALGHDWDETGRTAPTCTEDGVISFVCSHDATHTKTEPITKLGHDWETEWTIDVEPTCETAGSKSHHCSRCDEKNDVTVIEALGHDWDETGRTAPTCTEDGVISFVCSHDATHTKTEPITKLGHDWETEWTIDVEPTAETAGSKSHHCSRCDEVTDVTVIDPLGHIFATEFTVDVEPTCETAGSKSRHCTDANCDIRTEVTPIAPLGHDWDETGRTDATCTEDGVINYVCSHDATHTKTEPIDALGHDWDETGRTDATCTEDGVINYVCSHDATHTKTESIDALGHDWETEWTVDVEPTCETAGSKSHHCSRCDEKNDITVIEALGHDWVESNRTEATCTEDGVINYVCSHDATHTKNEPITKLGHDWETEMTVDVAPTCESAGSKSFHCTRCDEIIGSTAIEPLGHDWDETGRTAPTCTEDGVINYVCSHDATHTKNEPITKLGHDWETEMTVDVAPTCESAGSKSFHCTRCDETIGSTAIEPLGHDWDETGRTEATCTEDGVINYVCSHDNTHTKTEPIAKLGHDWATEWTVDVEPTCETAGSKSHHCSRCDEKNDVTVIEALGHDWDETGRTNATCTEDGVINYVCSHDATHTKNEPITKLGHDWETEFTVDVEPTCETAGSKSHHCSRCDEKSDVTVIEALGHDWDETGRTDATCTEDGVINYVCSNDDTHTKNEPIAKLGHTFGEYVYDRNATTEKDGTKTRVCSVCGEKDTITAEGTKLTAIDSTSTFIDVPAGKWYTSFVDKAVSYGLFKGITATTFEPNTAMNRAMFVQVLANLEGIDTEALRSTATKFTDVPAGKWYTGAVKWANDNSIVNGVSDTEFAPTKNINRQEMCTMLVRFATFKGITLNKVNTKVAFADDGQISNFAKESVYACQQAGIVNGMTATEFAPKGTATRGQVAKILSVFYDDYIAVK